jgi:RHS repeat-associated protein
VYNYTDHLGNIRVSYTLNPADGKLKILEENHYYPFGLKHSNYNVDKADFDKDETGFFVILKSVERSEFQYKYNGKEYQDELELNWYDMEARNYMPDIGRWGNMDELAEAFKDLSPYNFSYNNPISFSDPSGLAPEDSRSDEDFGKYEPNSLASTFINKTGKVLEYRDDGDDNVYLVDNDWEKGGSKKGLSILGKEKAGVEYIPGFQYIMDENNQLGYDFNWYNRPRPSGAITPIGGAFDIFGIWDAFASSTEDQPGVALLTFLLTKGKKGKATSTLAVSQIPKGFKEAKKFGYQHGQKVFEYMGKYYSKDVDSHNGGVWKVFK